MRGRSLICIAFAWVCSFCKGKQSFRLSSLIYKWNCHVSTHGSRRGSRHVPASRTFGWIFVSTHGSLAGADRSLQVIILRGGVSTHGSLAGADHGCLARYAILYVSTHGSLAGADAKRCTRTTGQATFQLTAPLREPTFPFLRSRIQAGVSTHGSLAGADIFIMGTHFPTALFQLTAPLREPTRATRNFGKNATVSTHGSLAGADVDVSIVQ